MFFVAVYFNDSLIKQINFRQTYFVCVLLFPNVLKSGNNFKAIFIS